MPYQFTYFLLAVFFLLIWLMLFFHRKDVRREMLTMSSMVAIFGPLTDIVYTKDWWAPLTLTKTAVGIESFIFAFAMGGVASIIYEEIFKTRLKQIRLSKKRQSEDNLSLILLIIFGSVLFFGMSLVLRFNSFVSTVLSATTLILIILSRRHDLIPVSIISGIIMMIVAVFVYTILEMITPGWVRAFWHFKNVPDIIILNVPIDDVVWYFLLGALIGIVYPFWHEGKFIKL